MENEGHSNFSSDKRVRELGLVLYKKEELQEKESELVTASSFYDKKLLLVCKVLYTPKLFQPQHNLGAANLTSLEKQFSQTEHCFPSMFKILFSHSCKK